MRRLLVLAFLPLVAACTTQEDMSLLHREITDVQRQVQSLSTSSLNRDDFSSFESSLEEQSARILRSNADLGVRLDDLQEQIEALRASLDLTTRQLEQISQELARTTAPATLPPVQLAEPGAGDAARGGEDGTADSGETATAAPSGTPEELYKRAYEDYLRGNYELAIEGFQEYVDSYPSTDVADNALYWIGECYDALDRDEEALKAFSAVLERYPASDKAAAAQLKKGLVHLKLGDQGQGVINLQYVIYEHPGTREADLAREKLRSLGITIR